MHRSNNFSAFSRYLEVPVSRSLRSYRKEDRVLVAKARLNGRDHGLGYWAAKDWADRNFHVKEEKKQPETEQAA